MALEIFRLVGSVFVDTDKADKSLQKTDKNAEAFGGTLVKGVKTAAKFAAAVVGAATAATGAIVALAESTREYRTEQGKLLTAFEVSGFAADEARETYEALNGVLGDSGQAVEAASHLAKLVDNEKDLKTWTDICTGVFATFGDSLPIEGLTEAANETAKVGQLTGSLADALNWAGINEETFQSRLDACTNEQQRQALITETLNGLYSEAAGKYREINAEVIAANEAQDKLNQSMAKVGAAVEPIVTRLKLLGATVLEYLMPAITVGAEFLVSTLEGLIGALEDAAKWVSENSDEIVEWTGYIVAAGVGVGTFLLYMNWGQIMTAAAAALNLVTASIKKMSAAFMANPIGLIISLIASLIAYIVYLYNTNEEFRAFMDATLAQVWEKLKGVIDWIKTNVMPVISQVVTWLVEKVGAFWDWLTSSFQSTGDSVGGIWQSIVGFFQSAWDWIVGIWEACQPFFQGVWDGVIMPVWGLIQEMIGAFQMAWDVIKLVWGYVEPYFSAIWEGIKAAVSILWTWLSTGFKNAWEVIKLVWSVVASYFLTIWENIKAVFSVVVTFFGGLFRTAWEVIKAVWDVAISFFTMVWAGIKAVFAVVKGVLSGDFSDAWEAIKNLWDKVKAYFAAVWNGIKGVFGSTGKWFGDTFKAAWEAIKKVFANWGTFFSGLWDKIKNTFSKIGTNISDAIGKSVRAGLNAVIASIEGTINGAINLINGAINLINNIPGVSVGHVKAVDFPRLEKGGVLERGQVGLLEGNGAEAVVPLHQNRKWINAVAQDMETAMGGASGGQVVALLTDILDVMAEIANGGIYLDGDALVGRLAKRMDNKLGQIQARKARA